MSTRVLMRSTMEPANRAPMMLVTVPTVLARLYSAIEIPRSDTMSGWNSDMQLMNTV